MAALGVGTSTVVASNLVLDRRLAVCVGWHLDSRGWLGLRRDLEEDLTVSRLAGLWREVLLGAEIIWSKQF